MSVLVKDVGVCEEMRLLAENHLFQDFRYIWKESRQSTLMQTRKISPWRESNAAKEQNWHHTLTSMPEMNTRVICCTAKFQNTTHGIKIVESGRGGRETPVAMRCLIWLEESTPYTLLRFNYMLWDCCWTMSEVRLATQTSELLMELFMSLSKQLLLHWILWRMISFGLNAWRRPMTRIPTLTVSGNFLCQSWWIVKWVTTELFTKTSKPTFAPISHINTNENFQDTHCSVDCHQTMVNNMPMTITTPAVKNHGPCSNMQSILHWFCYKDCWKTRIRQWMSMAFLHQTLIRNTLCRTVLRINTLMMKMICYQNRPRHSLKQTIQSWILTRSAFLRE